MRSTVETGPSEPPLLPARDTAARLGIKLDTLYAYVSRGLIRSVAVPGSRERRYRAEDVERLRLGRGAERGREPLIPVIDSAICLIANGRFYYRGVDALRLADSATLEEVAALLWETAAPAHPSSSSPPPAGRRGFTDAPPGGLIERCQVRLAMLGAADLAALDLSRGGIVRSGWAILNELAAVTAGATAEGAHGEAPAHRRLAARWRLDAAGADVVRRCLVLLADHELNASAFVARCGASTGATPYAVGAAALGALSGRRHGGASARAEALFREIGPGSDPLAVMAARLARGEELPGLGQPLYPEGDPRARAIIAAIARARPEAGQRIAAAAAAATQLSGQHPNVDFALGAVTSALALPPGSALGLFLVARTAGWIAHAIEQYDSGVLIRPRARYIGPPPKIMETRG